MSFYFRLTAVLNKLVEYEVAVADQAEQQNPQSGDET